MPLKVQSWRSFSQQTPCEATGIPPVQAFPPPFPCAAELNTGTLEIDNEGGESTSSTSKVAPGSNTGSQKDVRFHRGDHVYQWCSVMGIPRVFSHHGIVIDVEDLGEGCEENQYQQLTIVDFSNLLLRNGSLNSQEPNLRNEADDDETEEDVSSRRRQQSGSISNGTFFRSGSSFDNKSSVVKKGALRCYKTSSKDCFWRKVSYDEPWAHLWKRSGTCTPVSSDPPDVVLKRVNFLLAQSQLQSFSTDKDDDSSSASSLLPNFHPIFANCECLAVFCKTGSWSTLQAASFLSHAAVGQVKVTATTAAACAAQTATVPAAGVWGWLGYSTTVPLLSVQPLIVPALCLYGGITIGGPAICLTMAKKRWKDITHRLNEALDAELLQVSLLT